MALSTRHAHKQKKNIFSTSHVILFSPTCFHVSSYVYIRIILVAEEGNLIHNKQIFKITLSHLLVTANLMANLLVF